MERSEAMRHEERNETGAHAIDKRSRRRSPAKSRRMLAAAGIIGLVLVIGVAFMVSGPEPAAPAALSESAPLAVPILIAPTGREVYVTADGSAVNPGTRDAPVDLATALSSNTPASPGDTIWLRGGTYTGNFVSSLKGIESAPFHVRQFPGERATIAGAAVDRPALTVEGAWTWFRDFEVTISPPAERLPLATEPLDLRQTGAIMVKGPGLAFVNLVIHDLPRGIEVLSGSPGTLVYGNLVYYSGWADSPRGTGIKSASENRDQYILDNLVFGQGGAGISVSMTAADRLVLEGNISFNNGVTGDFFDRNLLVEGGTMIVNQTFTYYSPGRRGGENNFGYALGCVGIVAQGNYWAHAESYPVNLSKCHGELTDNVLIGAVDQSLKTRYPQNTHHPTTPTGLATFVRPNRYDESRAHIVVFNWDGHAAVNVDVSNAKMSAGTTYEIRDAQNYFGPVVASGTYQGGRLNIPVTKLTQAAPAGNLPTALGHTAPTFGVFVLLKSPVTTTSRTNQPGSTPATSKPHS